MITSATTDREWVLEAMNRIRADMCRSSDTHLIRVEPLCRNGVDFYLKDESTHPSGSLKHRLARSLFMYGICGGHIRERTPIIESSSGSTAISEAYFARLLGLPFIAVIPRTTSHEKIANIRFYGGECELVEASQIYTKAEELAKRMNGHYMDQFTYAERATDWRGNNNIAASLFEQLERELHPLPRWIVVGAGTGGTSASIGRFIRYHQRPTLHSRLCVVDPEHSVFYDFFHQRDPNLVSKLSSRIEGIGRPRVEKSFLPDVVDHMLRIPDVCSFATIWWLEKVLGRKCGSSTGTNVYGALQLSEQMQSLGETGSIVTLICDAGERYLDTSYNEDWLHEQGLNIAPILDELYSRFPDATP